uniref:inositol-polyphosphate 5-phosphatase n=1 Tax=Ditylenchus dipsaci TaxID=166011 RepID=A0A915D3Y1_9BILA
MERTNCLLRVGKKKFDFYDAHKLILNWATYKDDDREQLEYALREKPIEFPPTYPWSECPTKPDELMNTRAPAWCDRILMSDFAWKNITGFFCSGCVYRDHKP